MKRNKRYDGESIEIITTLAGEHGVLLSQRTVSMGVLEKALSFPYQ